MAPSTAVSRWSARAWQAKLRRRVRVTSRTVCSNRWEAQVTRTASGRGPPRASFSTFRSISDRNDGVSTTPRPLMMSRIGALPSPGSDASPLSQRQPALVRGQDAELLAVLGDRAPGDRETALLQRLRDLLIGLRLD